MPGKILRRLALPILPLPANALQLGEADPLRDGPERRPGLDRLQLLGIANENDFRAGPLGLADEARQLLRGNHSGLVDHQNIARTQFPAPGLPAIIPGRQRARGDAGRFLETLGGFPGQRRPMNAKTLALPCFARGGQHGALARSRQSDDDGELLLSGDMADGLLLLLGQKRARRQRLLHMGLADAMAPRRAHPVGRENHAALDLDHFPRRIAGRLQNLPTRAANLRRQLHKSRRAHGLRKRPLKQLGLVDIAMQRPRNVAPIEHALLAGDDRQNLLRLFPDQFGVAPRRLAVQPAPRHLPARAAASAWRERPYARSARSPARAPYASDDRSEPPARPAPNARWRPAPTIAGFRRAESASAA